jgi:hypothetical protein
MLSPQPASLSRWPLGPDAHGRPITLVRRSGADGACDYAIYRDDAADPAELYGLSARVLARIAEIAAEGRA